MSRKLLRLISFLFAGMLLMTSQQLKASHAMGADLTYQCMGGNTYKLRVSFYRDCIGINAPTNVYVNVRSTSCGQNLGVTCYPIAGTGQQVTYLCPTAQSTCNGGSFTGIQEWVYEGVITLPLQCPDWSFSYTLCCRNAAITTISTPGSNTFYIYATLNNTISPCNSSPTFSNKPVPFACLGQQLCFNHGAVDPDGDSLVYSLVTPKQTATADVNYLAPYNATNPLNSFPTTQFNTQTGDICFTPQQLQVTVMAVLVKEYRNGVLIGSVVRDIQVTVLNCNNNLPTLSGINGTNNYNMTVCANTPFCFNIFSNDADAGQQISLFANNGISAGTFNSSVAQHPTGTFCWTPKTSDISNTPNCFTVRVNDDACPYTGSQTYSYCITVKGIIVDAGPDQYIACSDQATITANASGGTAPYSYLWSNGFTGQTQTVPVGTYVVTVSDATCSSTDTVEVKSAFVPIADFTWTGSCVFGPIQFTDQSNTAGGISSWTWNFGDGSGSSLQNPSHNYSAPGTYNVSLIIQNIYGCIDTIIQPVTIVPPPVPSFTVGTSCASNNVAFTNTSTPIGTNWNWSFSNGTSSTVQDPIIIFATAGTYTGTLIVSDGIGCSDTVTQSFVVNPVPVANFSTSGTSCQNSSVTFTNSSTGGISYDWDFGDGDSSNLQNPTHTYTSSGNYNVSLIVTNAAGCSDTIVKSIHINAPPFADAGPDKVLCLGSTITLSAAGGTTYNWLPGNQSGSTISVSPSSDTSYVVIVTDANGCTDADTVLVHVNALPIPIVSPNQVICAGQSATLSASGGISYNWNPSGSTTSTITITPNGSTTYAVNVIDSNGCQATAFANVTVHPNPVSVLQTPVFICGGMSEILDPGPSGTTYLWNTGATSQTISVNTQGAYTVTITNQFGCSTVSPTTVTVGGQVVNNNNAISICQGQTATLNPGYTGSTFLWANGATSQTITVSTSGLYQVTVTDANGCTGVIGITVNVHMLPIPNFTPVDVCITQPVSFHDVSSVNGDSIVSWSWNLGDGNVSYQQDPLHSYSTSASYPVVLTVTTSAGCSATLGDTVNVYPLPVANFSFNHDCQGSAIPFQDLSTTGLGNITIWNWNFGDGASSTLQNPTHTYATAGTYNVSLVSSTAGGCSDTKVLQIQIFPKPTIAFTPSALSVCAKSTVSLNNTSTSSNGAINTWNWSFGDGTTSSIQNPTHTYASAGTYTISLTGITSHGCSASLTKTIVVNALPLADAGSNASICFGTSTSLTATGGNSYVWSTGAATATISVSPIVNTTYYATVTNASGCTARDSVKVTVKTLPTANAGPDKSICNGGNINLTATGGGTYSWNPGGANTPVISVNPSTTTNYIVTVTGANGCQKKDTARVTVNSIPIASAGPDQAVCTGTTATLTASGGSTYLWQYNGATTSTIYVNPSTASSYIVTVTNAFGCSAKDTVALTLNPTPSVSLASAFFCTGSNAILDAGNPGMTYDWMPNGEVTQTITVATPGLYTVVVTNGFGCYATASTNVVEGGTGIASVPLNVIACQGATVTLDAGNPGMNFLWSTGATSQTIPTTTTGLYQVTVTDAGGCSSTFGHNVTINPKPVVNFTAGNSCLGNATQFADNTTLSSGNISLWNWNFNNGNSSVQQNPSQQYVTAGTYSTTLIVTSNAGCIDSVKKNVTIDPLPVADFTANTVCKNAGTQFTNASSIASGVITNWNWSFGDNKTDTTQSPVHTYATDGNYIVTLIVASTSGCRDTSVYSVNVNPTPTARFTAPDVCDGDSMRFANASFINNGFISDVAWDFGDGNTSTDVDPVHLYANSGTYIVTLTVGSDLGCQDAIAKQINVNAKPVVNFATAPVCDGNAANFIDQSAISAGNVSGWYWNFGDGSFTNQQNPSHAFASAGNYTISLVATSNNGCRDTASKSTAINPNPIAAFTTSDVCLGSSTQFTDASNIAAGGITSWSWNFGDAATSNNQNPTHSYASTGTYIVDLIVASANGCIDTVQQSVNVFPVPVANFASNNVCLTDQTEFFDQSSIVGGSNFNYNWNFGDATSSTLTNPVHKYATAGNYNVNLTITTPYGCTSSKTIPVSVYDLPIPQFTASNVCLNQLTQFQENSSIPNGTINGWNWTLGDATNSSAQEPTHYYVAPGMYRVTLEVTSDQGCKASKTDSLMIFALPTPSIASGTGCVNDNISFADTSSGSNNSINNWNWNFGNGVVSTNQNPNIAFTSAGQHFVSLTTTNANGCNATTSLTVTVSPLPIAGFTNGSACANSAISFTNSSTIPAGGTITGYSWDFGDGSGTSSAINPSYTYANPGTYTVTLIAISNAGCTDTITGQVIIHPVPTANFNQANAAGCGPIIVQFNDSSYIGSGNIISWYWDFGDGQTSNLQDPSHTYSVSGSYNVSLTVTSDSGCTNTTTINNAVTVYPGPQAEFTAEPMKQLILNPNFNFINLSTGGQTYAWTFGDGSASFDYEPAHTYGDTGTYNVILWVTNSYGCRDSVQHPVRVDPEFSFWIPNAFTPNEDGVNDGFNVTGISIVDVKLHIFNRWGDEIFFSQGRENAPWDGSVAGMSKPAQEGVYVYMVEVKDVWGQTHEKVGQVNLVR